MIIKVYLTLSMVVGTIGLIGIIFGLDVQTTDIFGIRLTPEIRSSIYTVMIVDGYYRLMK